MKSVLLSVPPNATPVGRSAGGTGSCRASSRGAEDLDATAGATAGDGLGDPEVAADVDGHAVGDVDEVGRGEERGRRRRTTPVAATW